MQNQEKHTNITDDPETQKTVKRLIGIITKNQFKNLKKLGKLAI